jgi:hypothetical protein
VTSWVEQAVLTLPERAADGHHPDRPSWDCRGCGEAWPCQPARAQLERAYGRDRVGLSVYMGTLLHAAAGEIPPDVDGQLFSRFLGWTR